MNKDIYGFSPVSYEMSTTRFLLAKWLFVSKMYRFVSPGCVDDLRLMATAAKSLHRQNGKRKEFFSFSHFVFPHWVTQFHGPLAYLRWRGVKSVQFWDFWGTVFLNLLRYVAILLPSPLDRLHHYVTAVRVKQWKQCSLHWLKKKTNYQITVVSHAGIHTFCIFIMLKAQINKMRWNFNYFYLVASWNVMDCRKNPWCYWSIYFFILKTVHNRWKKVHTID